MPQLGSTAISTGSGKLSHHKIVINAKNEIEFKGIPIFSLSILNSFAASTNKKKGMEDKKKKPLMNLRISHHYQITSSTP